LPDNRFGVLAAARDHAGVTTVRRVRPADAARVRALRLEMLADAPLAYLETLADAAARPHADFQARIAIMATAADRAQFVAERAGRFVGHAGGITAPDDPATTVIFAVYVTPAHRGTGVLGRLVEGVAEWSRSAGRPTLLLEVVTGNDRALRAYERLGFTLTGCGKPHPTIPGLTEMELRRPA
jgi:GNAT superfamily N-acetyltransferase